MHTSHNSILCQSVRAFVVYVSIIPVRCRAKRVQEFNARAEPCIFLLYSAEKCQRLSHSWRIVLLSLDGDWRSFAVLFHCGCN